MYLLVTLTSTVIEAINTKPIWEFKSQEQANQCLKEWQHRLFLDDWTVVLRFENYKDMPEIGMAGYSNFEFENCCSVITLCNKAGVDNGILKFCQELTLVHELLHCIYNWQGYDNSNYESITTSELQHQQIEKMARSLIMAKYNIEPDWFKNEG